MPRNYGRIATSIWRDDDFRKLPSGARFTYLMLIAQPNISAAGVLEVTDRRWQGNLGVTAEQLSTALDELVDAGYVLIDDDTQELLVRSFVKWDGGATNPLRRKAIADAAGVVGSSSLRDSIAVELDRNQVPHSLSNAYRDGTESRRVVVTGSDHSLDPQPATLVGEPVAAVADDPLSPFCPPHQPDGPTGPCGDCGTRRVAREYRGERQQRETTAAKLARLEAIAGCDRCNENGFIEGVAGELLGSCSHSRPLSPVGCKPREAATG